jgi:hypothetical protein
MKKIIIAALALAFASSAGIQAVNAQINPFGKWAQVGYTKEDSEMNQAAMASLYEKPDVKVGEKATWQNPASGNGGTNTVTRVYKYKEMPCVDLLSSFELKDSQDKSKKELKTTRCKVASGEWKILHK